MIRLLAPEIPWPAICRWVAAAGLGLALQTTLLLGLGLLAGRAVRRHGPALAALIYQVTLMGALLGGLLSLSLGGRFLPLWRLPLPVAGERLRPASLAGAGVAPAAPTLGTVAAGPGSPAWARVSSLPGSSWGTSPGPDRRESRSGPARRPGSASPGPSRRSPGPGGMGWASVVITGGWAAGVLALLFWLGLCQRHLGRLRRQAAPIREGAEILDDLCRRLRVRPPALLVSPRARGPFLTGLRRPAILLPAGDEGEIDPSSLRAILTHELVHLARQDCAWNLLARLACALCWPQPLFWLLSHRLRQASEEVCDQEVVRLEGDPRGYARCLLKLSERLLPSPRERALGLGVVPFRSALGRRIEQIMAGPRPRPLSPRGRAAVLLGAGAAVALALFLLPAGAVLPPAGAVAAGPRSAAGQQAEPSRRSPLADVSALAKPVTYTETRGPLGELVARVAADTGVTLTASAEVADEPVAVVVRDLPARELLEQVADLLDYQWMRQVRKGQTTFQIYQDVASKRREEAAREAALASAWQQLGEQIPQYIRMAARPPAEIERLLAEQKRWYEHLFQLPYAERLAVGMKDRALQEQFFMAEQLASPVTRSEAALLGQLTPAQWALLRHGQPLVFSTDPREGEIPLPDEIARALHGAQPRMGSETHYGSREYQRGMRERRQELKTAWAEATGYQVRIALDTSRLQSDGDLSLEASAIPLRGGRPASRATSLPANGAMMGIGVGPSYVFQWSPDERASAARHAVLEKDPVFGVKRPLRVDLKPRRPEEPYWKGAWGLGEMLPDVARVYGVSLISDAYTWDRTTTRFSSEAPIALYDLLDWLAGHRHVWDRRGRLIRFRYRAWPFARPQEVPMRLLRRWQALLDRDGALPLEEWLSAVATLTDAQLDTLFHIGQFRGPGAFSGPFDPRYALRLYLSLTPGQQQALWRGRPLPFAGMTPAQQALFLASLREQAQIRQGIPAPGSEPAVGPGAALSLTSDRQVWIFKQHGNWTGIHYEPAPQTPPTAAPKPASLQPTPAAHTSITRRTITTVTFRFQSGSGVEENIPLYVASPP